MCAVQPEEAVAARPDVDGRRRRHAPEVGRRARARHPRQDARQRLQVQELRRPPRPLSEEAALEPKNLPRAISGLTAMQQILLAPTTTQKIYSI